METEGGTFLSFHSMADYWAAIKAAPPGTFIKLGDLDKDMVRCSTCDGVMERKASAYHKHPKTCETCGVGYDENAHKHTPVKYQTHCGAGTIGFSTGCTVEAL